jgi:hypothetical protein
MMRAEDCRDVAHALRLLEGWIAGMVEGLPSPLDVEARAVADETLRDLRQCAEYAELLAEAGVRLGAPGRT